MRSTRLPQLSIICKISSSNKSFRNGGTRRVSVCRVWLNQKMRKMLPLVMVVVEMEGERIVDGVVVAVVVMVIRDVVVVKRKAPRQR